VLFMLRWISILLFMAFLYQIREVFPPFIVGGIIAYLLLPHVRRLSTASGMKLAWAVLIVYLLFLALIVFAFWFFGARATEQFAGLVVQRKEIVTNLLSQLSGSFHWDIVVDKTADDILSSAEKSFGEPQEIMHIGGLISKGMLYVLVTIVSSVYLIFDSTRVGHFFLRFMPKERRQTAINLSRQMNAVISKYVEQQIFLITLMGCVAYFILHVVFHLKYALVIAIMSGFLEIIPVLGPFLATSTATVVGISQIGVSAFLIIPCYVGARLVEDYIVVPRIMGHAVHLHPLAVIFAVLCGETMAGALGMLIAIPVAASIKVVLDFCYPPLGPEELDSTTSAL
jgi:predicted PurR-regulated permease PerM